MRTFNLSIPCILLFLVACAGPKPAPLDPMRMDFLPERSDFVSKDGSKADQQDVLTLAATADYLLIGEGHRNACDHAMQQQLVGALAQGGRLPAVGLEMVGTDMQPALDRFNKGELTAQEAAKKLQWQENWGYPFALFEPLFALAQEYGLPLGALNAPRNLVKAVSKKGLEQLTAQERELLPRAILPPKDEQREELKQVFTMHAQKGQGTDDLERFILIQSMWDTSMAENAIALRGRTGKPVVIIAGAGHVEQGWGIAHRLRTLDPDARIVSLLPLRDTFDFDPADGDAFFYCPDAFESRMGMTLEVREGRIVVSEVRRGGRADTAGIRPGDVLVEAQGQPVTSFMDLHHAGKAAHNQRESLSFVLSRRGDLLAVDLGPLGKRPENDKE